MRKKRDIPKVTRRMWVRQQREEWVGSKAWIAFKRTDRDDYLAERRENSKDYKGASGRIYLMLSIVSSVCPEKRDRALQIFNTFAERKNYPKRVFLFRANRPPQLVLERMARNAAVEMAQTVAARLNYMLGTEGMSDAISDLIEQRVTVYSHAVVEHPTVQVVFTESGSAQLGILGLLNGIIGVRKDSTGFLAAEYDDAGKLTKFIVREEEENKT